MISRPAADEPVSDSTLPGWAPRVRRLLLWAIAVLYVISVPWYRDASVQGRLWGLPDWVGVALLCYVVIAFLNAFAWLLTEIPDPPEPGAIGKAETATRRDEGRS